MNPGSQTKDPFIRRIAVIGLGKLGTPMLACFAEAGFYVTGVDKDLEKIKGIQERKALIDEPEVNELIKKHSYYIRAMNSTRVAIMDSDATFIVVATPSNPDGGFNINYVLEVCHDIGVVLKDKPGFHIVVLTSTVMPGQTNIIKQELEYWSGKKCGVDFGLCYNPEFIALGSVVRDFKNPDMVLIGESDKKSGEALVRVYEKIICGNIHDGMHTLSAYSKVHRMNFVNAEITKLAVNTFVTTKISYANMLGTLCEKFTGGDVDVVTNAVGSDSRIGKKYLKAGASYGGPCFPRDNHALVSICTKMEVNSDIPEATDYENKRMIQDVADIIEGYDGGGLVVGILGMSYKPGTTVTENSFGRLLCDELMRRNIYELFVYDPSMKAAFLPTHLHLAMSSNLIVIGTLHPEFETIPDVQWHGKVVIDPWRQYKRLKNLPDVIYVGLGLGPEEAV